MNSKINIYIDMDGVQTVYNKDDEVIDMMQPGYFRSRLPHAEVIEFIKKLQQDSRYEVTVLSAVFTDQHSIGEKAAWLDAQGITRINCLFIPCDTKKCDYVNKGGQNFLIDDYSKNLFEWESAGENFRGIKFLNEANGVNGTWEEHQGECLSYTMSADEMYQKMMRIAEVA